MWCLTNWRNYTFDQYSVYTKKATRANSVNDAVKHGGSWIFWSTSLSWVDINLHDNNPKSARRVLLKSVGINWDLLFITLVTYDMRHCCWRNKQLFCLRMFDNTCRTSMQFGSEENIKIKKRMEQVHLVEHSLIIRFAVTSHINFVWLRICNFFIQYLPAKFATNNSGHAIINQLTNWML